ncbi:helix-turn-helix domain-containing protein [Desulfotruncus alcoholivorax]|uniref:helix-turn-helix domain-containing protein n=1 Tax=Desulfotruncus alcoholivorax TaxID=265477 RepID=UPI00040E02CC|nr:helix-turn-helix transcriptional regulator [Desulfotruncus alcoholivorax]
MGIGERIKFLRNSLKLTQQEFANALDIDQGHIAGIEKGSKNPSKPLQKVICFTFYVNDIWLKTGKGEMFISPEEPLKNLMARYGEQAIIEAVNNIQKSKESSAEIIDVTELTRRAYDKDPQLKRMIDTLYILFSAGDEELKAWTSYQFKRAFPPDVVEDAQKKQQEKSRQATTS